MKKMLRYLVMVNLYVVAFLIWTHATIKKGGKTTPPVSDRGVKD